MRNSFMTERQPKMRQRDMQFTFWNNAISRFAKSVKSVSSRSLSLRSMLNCLGTGRSKDQFSWNNSFATQQTNEIFGSQRPVNYLAAHPTQKILEPAASTWGENGHLAVWLDPSNAWIYSQLHAATQTMIDLAKQASAVAGQPHRSPDKRSAGGPPALQLTDRVLKQLARELAGAIKRLGISNENRDCTRIRHSTHDRLPCSLRPSARSVCRKYSR